MRLRAREGATLAVSCGLLLLTGMALPLAAGAPTTTTTTTATAAPQGPSGAPTGLVLSVIPPRLPADGGSYGAIVVSLQAAGGEPSLALNDTSVFLTSSLEGVGTVVDEVTIPRGAAFAVADFTTTTTAGTTTISASSPGLGAASGEVETMTPSGFATHLAVIPVPGTQAVEPGATGTVVVETLDSAGLPARVASNVEVTLSSSSTSVVSLPVSSLLLTAGSVLSSTPYDLGVSPGSTTITGSASGFSSGSGMVTVQGASPFALRIFAQPDPLPVSTVGRLVVTLTDQAGNPVRAPSAVTVAIASSNTSEVAAGTTATIQAGEVYTLVPLTAGQSPGAANITASSAGLLTDFAPVTVSTPGTPVKIKLMTAPDPVLADQGTYSSVAVALTDAAGNPAMASSPLSITLTSSNSAVGNVTGSVTIQPGQSYAVASFSSTFFVGTTTITALAQNLQSASASLSTYGTIPAKVVVRAMPSSLPADGGTYAALEVMLQDATGLPAVAPVGVQVQLASARTDIVNVNTSVTIPAGSTYVLADVETTISPGTANITGSSSGYVSSSTGFTTTSPAPSQLGVYVAPASGIQSLGQSGDAVVAVQLQDSGGSPALAKQGITVALIGSNGSVLANSIQLQIPAGSDYNSTLVKASGPGSAVLTASSSGLSSASATLSLLSVPVSAVLTASAPVITVGTPATVQLKVLVLGAPLPGANVTFTATTGLVNPPVGVTDSSGILTGTFISQVNGVSTITAAISSPLIGSLTAGTNILLTKPGSQGAGGSTPSLAGRLGLFLPIIIVLFVVVIIAVGAYLTVRRRRRSPNEGEEDEPSGK